MDDRKNVSNQGGQGHGNKPRQSGQPGRREGQVGHGAQERQGGYKGGRQETGGIPNPDDRDDDTSAGSFRGIAEREKGGH